MQYVKGQRVFYLADADIENNLEGINRFETVVEYRDRKTGLLGSRRFSVAQDANTFVDAHRAIAKLDKDGAAIPGQFERIGDWDWMGIWHSWQRVAENQYPMPKELENFITGREQVHA